MQHYLSRKELSFIQCATIAKVDYFVLDACIFTLLNRILSKPHLIYSNSVN